MKISEVIKVVDLTKRAIKFYEEEGLLHIARDENGYRKYSTKDIERLRELSIYRKLGISLEDIKHIMFDKNPSILFDILKKKVLEHKRSEDEIRALKQFIETHEINELYQTINYDTVASAIQDAIPGFYGYYFLHHFLPYLHIRIETPQQNEAYQNILAFWDNTDIKLPISYKIVGWLMYRCFSKEKLHTTVEQLDATIQLYLNPTEEQYETLKKQVLRGVKMKNSFVYKYSISGFAQRKFMKELQNKGYNDIFIPNMILLSSKYQEYHNALMQVNKRICNELGLYYDSHYNLVTQR